MWHKSVQQRGKRQSGVDENTEEVFPRNDGATWSARGRGIEHRQNACFVALVREQRFHTERIAATCRGALVRYHCPHCALRRARCRDIVDELDWGQMERPCGFGERRAIRLHREALEDTAEELVSVRPEGGRLL